ncbi:helix-turn-helix transcriptional regulator [Pseudonocardia sichuanensis]
MAEYAAHVTTDITAVTDEQLDDLVEAFAPVAGVPSMLGGRLSVQLTVVTEHPRLADASEHAEAVTIDVLRRVGIANARTGRAVGVEVLTTEEFDRRLGLPTDVDDLVSTTEAGEILGVARQRVLQLADRDDFPEPVRRGQRGLFWSAAALRRFAAGWDRRPGPKTRAAG